MDLPLILTGFHDHAEVLNSIKKTSLKVCFPKI